MSAGSVQYMVSRPVDEVYSLVERAYVRLQAGDILIRCLEEGSTEPMQELVEGLILAGPQNLGVLHEIFTEVGSRKSQVQEDVRQVIRELKQVLKGYGLSLHEIRDNQDIFTLTPLDIMAIMQEQGIEDSDTQSSCLRVFQDSRELVRHLITNLDVLTDIETYLQDWSWGLTYQAAHQEDRVGKVGVSTL
jgi:hypothetical protein